MKRTSTILFLILFYFKSYGQNKCETQLLIDTINLESFFKQDKYSEVCKISIIDSIAFKFNKTGELKYLKKMNSLYKQSDGIFTEQIMSSSSRIFDSKLIEWFKIVYQNKADLNYKKMFIQSVSIKMSEDIEVEKFVNKKLDELCPKLNKQQQNYLKKIRTELNPKILD
jgi:hypothetical protein